MKTFVSPNFNGLENTVPIDTVIYQLLDKFGYNRYISKKIIADLIIANRIVNLGIEYRPINEYEHALLEYVNINRKSKVVEGAVELYIALSKKYDLSIMESITDDDFKNIPKSFNYSFDIGILSKESVVLLGITDNQLKEIDELPEDIIDILNIANNIGVAFNSTISYMSYDSPMKSYSDITKISKYKYSDPLFNYKFSIKNYNVLSETSYEIKASELIVAIYLGSIQFSIPTQNLLKLVGLIALSEINKDKDVRIIIYELIGGVSVNKIVLNTANEILSYFKTEKQLSLFPADNTSVINKLSSVHKNSNILFIPDITTGCYFNSINSKASINIISSNTSKFNIQYANVCKKTNGMLITI